MTQRDSKDFRIRDARPEELDEVSAVMSDAYGEYAKAFPADLWATYARDIANVRSRLEVSVLIVAEQGGRIAGAVTFYPDGALNGWPEGRSGVRLLAIHPQSRGIGVGRALTEECIRRSRALGLAAVGLHSTEAMSIARKMYQGMGFVREPEYDHRGDRGFVVYAYRLDL